MANKYDLQLMLGLDIYISELELLIHQPTLSELGMTMLSFSEINQIMGIFAFEDPDGKLSNFQSFMLVTSNLKGDLKKNLNLLFDLLFPNCKISFIHGRSMYIEQSLGEFKKTILIDEQNFELFQEVIKEIFCISSVDETGPVYNTKGEMANKIKEKLLQGRKKAAERKAQFTNGNSEGDFLVKYISVVSVSTGISVNEIKKYTLYQLYDILNRFNLWFNYDLDLRIRLAGGEVKKSAEDWTKNIH